MCFSALPPLFLYWSVAAPNGRGSEVRFRRRTSCNQQGTAPPIPSGTTNSARGQRSANAQRTMSNTMYGVSLKWQGRSANRHFGGSGVRAINTGMSCLGSFVAHTVRLGKY